MTNHCDFNTNLECGCDHKCRVKVEVPFIKPQTSGLLVVMTFGIIIALIAWATMEGHNESVRLGKVNQEQVKW